MPLCLVTNDDGIDSRFLSVLVEALRRRFEVVVAAPAGPQSWVGRAVTTRGAVSSEIYSALPCPAWAIGGTPADCVNIALSHLVPRAPALVVSGINMGFNVTLPLVLGSGTIAGAMEAALWGVPALALSMRVPADRFHAVHAARGALPELAVALAAAADHGAAFAGALVGAPSDPPVVHSINYPLDTAAETPMERTRPALRRFRQLFIPDEGGYRFAFHPPTSVRDREGDDDRCLFAGRISHTVLDLGVLGADLS